MKSGIYFACAAMLAFTTPASAAEISAAECSAIRNMAKSLAEANLQSSKNAQVVQKALMSLIVDTIDAPQIRDTVEEIQDTLKPVEMDKAALVSGLTALNKVCPR